MKISPSCDRCSSPYETLSHLLYECSTVQTFWQKVIAWWNEKRSEKVTLIDTDIFFGYKPESSGFYALNHFLIIAKYHIFLSWLNMVSPSLDIFLLLLNEKILYERTIAVKNNTMMKFRSKMDNNLRMSSPQIFAPEVVPLFARLFYYFCLTFFLLINSFYLLSYFLSRFFFAFS